jgi:hypothetical protein
VHIVQRGAVQPLIEMLQSPDVQLREMSAFALGRLAQVTIFFLFHLLYLYKSTKIPVMDETMLHLLVELATFFLQNNVDLAINDFIVT